ncbi:MAG: hypothetical protein ACLVH9_04660 [Fusobacterium sp.]|uniref:hypothetical protein n=1 Tax=Fusobacterium sp. TaxID=68766 RepID=UPI00399984FE
MENDELDNILTDENKRKELKEYCLNILNKIEQLEQLENSKATKLKKSFCISSKRCPTCGRKY